MDPRQAQHFMGQQGHGNNVNAADTHQQSMMNLPPMTFPMPGFQPQWNGIGCQQANTNATNLYSQPVSFPLMVTAAGFPSSWGGGFPTMQQPGFPLMAPGASAGNPSMPGPPYTSVAPATTTPMGNLAAKPTPDKENQVNAKPAALAFAATKQHSNTGQAGAPATAAYATVNSSASGCGNLAAATSDNTKPAAAAKGTLSPYERRMTELNQARQAAGDNYVLIMLSDTDQLLGRDDDDDEEDEDDEMDPEEYENALNKLSQAQIDKGFHAMIVPEAMLDLEKTLHDDLLYADPRNERGSCMISLNTYSSFCMYPVISKQLTAAQKLVNAATKLASATKETPALAQKAFETSMATIMAMNSVDHWRHDTEDPEEVDKIAKRVVKLAKELLAFTDAELGLKDAHSRSALLHYLKELAADWMSCDCFSMRMTFCVPKNGQGKGRNLVCDQAAPPAAKKQTTPQLALVSPAKSSTALNNSNASLPTLTSYFSAIGSKLSDRVKTIVQLAITDLQTSKVEHVVVSGATDMKKMHHLLAYLTGSSANYQYHSQKGSNTKGCYFELSVPGRAKCWIAETSAAGKASAAGAGLVVDKSVKIVQLFQGLNCNANGGIVYDSDLAKSINTAAASLVFVSPTKGRFAMLAQAIAPAKSMVTKIWPMPRIATYGTSAKKSGFGLNLAKSKKIMMGDRQDPKVISFGNASSDSLGFWTRPVCNTQGGSVCIAEIDELLGGGGYLEKICWKRENVLSAGPPDGVDF